MFPTNWLGKVFAETIQLGNTWDSRSVDAQDLSALLLGVGEAIQTCIQDPATRYKRHYEWTQWVACSLSPLDADSQLRMSKEILTSTVLPDQCKLDVHRKSSPMVWIRNFQHIAPLLPSCETERLQLAPWCAMPTPKPGMSGGMIAKNTLASINQALTEVTSPTLYTMLNVMACEDDWCDWSRMSTLLNLSKGKNVQLNLPDNLEENIHDATQPY